MNRIRRIAAAVVLVLLLSATVGMAEGYLPIWTNTFTTGSTTFTNITGHRMGIASVFMSADMGATHTGTIWIVNHDITNILVSSAGSGGHSNTLSFIQGSGGARLDALDRLIFNCTYTNALKYTVVGMDK